MKDVVDDSDFQMLVKLNEWIQKWKYFIVHGYDTKF